jgi:hypothetical protein
MAKITLTNSGGGAFETAPEGNGKAVCVDITPLKKVQTQYGEKEKFKLVFELDKETFGTRENGDAFTVWSSGFTPSTHEKAALPKFLKTWLSKDFPAQLETFDVETLIGRPAFVVIVHETGGADGKTVFATIKACTADNSGAPIKPTGKFVREEDRNKTTPQGGASQFRAAEKPIDAGRLDWQKCKVHVGRNKGIDLGDLDLDDVGKLLEKWLPAAKANPKPLADDKRLIVALEAAQDAIRATQAPAAPAEEEEVPY